MNKLFLFLCLTSCCYISNMEREANLKNGSRYIPMLKEYIQKDDTVTSQLKDTYFYSLDMWLKMMTEKGK